MPKQQALQFLAQVAQDFLNTLPLSARESFQRTAQDALNTMAKDEPKEPPKEPAP